MEQQPVRRRRRRRRRSSAARRESIAWIAYIVSLFRRAYHWIGILLIVAHGGSILTLERFYHAGEPQLMKIGWFARIMRWLGGLRDRALEIARSTAVWQWSAKVAADFRAWFRGLLQSAR